jgi:hypothetical protein
MSWPHPPGLGLITDGRAADMRKEFVAVALAFAMTASAVQTTVWAQANGTLAGTAKDEAKKPYADYTVRARDVQQGTIATATPLDQDAKFRLGSLQPAHYVVELVNKDGKVVCSEGPFNLTQQNLAKDNIDISCRHVPAAWWLLGAAAAGGITAGVVASGPASAAQ